MLANTSTTYGWVAIALHWLMAMAIFGLFVLGLWMVELNYYASWYHDAPYMHKAIGVLLLFFLVFRLLWRCMNKRPQLMGAAWEKVVALAVHRLHYMFLFVVGISGYLIPTAQGVGIDVLGWFVVPANLWLDQMGVEQRRAELIGWIHYI